LVDSLGKQAAGLNEGDSQFDQYRIMHNLAFATDILAAHGFHCSFLKGESVHGRSTSTTAIAVAATTTISRSAVDSGRLGLAVIGCHWGRSWRLCFVPLESQHGKRKS
jgi:hypothetical protein